MPEPVDVELYRRVKASASKRFLAKTSAYRSAWIVKEYKRLGGRYRSSSKSPASVGLTRWFAEQWVDLQRPVRADGKVVGYRQCGRSKASDADDYPYCRPTRRVSSKTPTTVAEAGPRRIASARRLKASVGRFGRVQVRLGSARKQK